MHAIRSKTGAGFQRSGIRFAPDHWTLVKDPTPEQLAEPQLEIIEVKNEHDKALDRFPVGPEPVAEEQPVAPVAPVEAVATPKAVEAAPATTEAAKADEAPKGTKEAEVAPAADKVIDKPGK